MKLVTIKDTRLVEIEEASCGRIEFKLLDGTVKGLKLVGPFGPIFIEIDSYSVRVCEAATKTVYHLGFFVTAADTKLFIEKEFPSEAERSTYISEYLSLTAEDELTLETREVQDD